MTTPVSAQDVNRLHDSDDVDNGGLAHHHTLGIGPGQASPGPHTHDGKTSKKLVIPSSGVIGSEIRIDARANWAATSSRIQADASELTQGTVTGWHWDSVGHNWVIDTAGWYVFTAAAVLDSTAGFSAVTLVVVTGINGVDGRDYAQANPAIAAGVIYVDAKTTFPAFYTAGATISGQLYASSGAATVKVNARMGIARLTAAS